MNEYSLITKKDFPTHKLIVKKSDGNYKIIRLTTKEAKIILNQIKDWKNPYIELEQSVELYPKKECRLEKLDKEEFTIRQDCYLLEAEKLKEAEKERLEKEKMKKVDDWIKKNPQDFDEIFKKAKLEIFKKFKYQLDIGFLSEKALILISKNKARIEVGKNI